MLFRLFVSFLSATDCTAYRAVKHDVHRLLSVQLMVSIVL